MGWGNCGTDGKGRKIGYLWRGKCDHKGCKKRISRGVSEACGGMHGTSEGGCEGYFCSEHLYHVYDPFGEIGRQKGMAHVCEKCKHQHNEYLLEEIIESHDLIEKRTDSNVGKSDAD